MKNYRFYIIQWYWNGGEGYDPTIIYKSETEEEARKIFQNKEVNIDFPLLDLFEKTKDDYELLDRKEF